MNFSKYKILKNASWVIVCRIVQALMSFVVGTISARYLGPSNYGLISYAASIVTFLVPVAQLGMRHTLVQEIISTPEEEGKILGTTLVFSGISSVFSIIGMASFVAIVNRGESDTIIVCVLYSLSLMFQSMEMIQYWFQAKLLSKYIALTSFAAYTVVSLYRIVLLISGKSVYWFALSQVLDFLLISAVLLVIFRRLSHQKLQVSFSVFRRLFSKSKYYIVSSVMVSLFSQMDHVMLTLMLGEETNGIYSAALTCANFTGFIFAAVIDSVRPVIFESQKISTKQFEQRVSQLYTIIIAMGLLQSIGFTIASGLIISILYGPDYSGASNVLSVITWYTTFSYMGTVRNIWILAENKQRFMWVINLSGVIFNFVGNMLLIPQYGPGGAAFASVCTQFFTNVLLCAIIKPIRHNLSLIARGLDFRILKDILKRE